ncbi:hypothetical protein SAMN05421863_103524 [Nitrosomonas communis]|uniref:Uncharacterized protein n=1 Tax=Nitrosomonas communis TaxID=44574 RepID=A0A1I4RU37_9PROT|nr:hypothetical protein SAMN05421863_103524 [Nitrosomonas communis]
MFKDTRSFFIYACAYMIIGGFVSFGMIGMQLILPNPKHELKVVICYVDEIDTVDLLNGCMMSGR